jgi:transcriptional regulator with XRE-family HTH domain
MSQDIEKEAGKEPVYRVEIGLRLKEFRLDKSFSIKDIEFMTDLIKGTILKIEKGEVKDIDSYVAYAKAVAYPWEPLSNFGIKLEPLKQLSPERKAATRLTAKIRKYIVNTDFLLVSKTVEEIKDELIRINQITSEVRSTEIAGVMRNLAEGNLIRTQNQGKGKKNLYFKI